MDEMKDSAPRPIEPVASAVDPVARMRRLTRRSFTVGGAAALAGAGGLVWLANATPDDGAPWPLRRMLELNERVAETGFGSQRLAPEFAADQIEELRINGLVGLNNPIDPASWTIRVTGKVDRTIPLAVVKRLPVVTMTTELKCVEGWSRVFQWTGVRLADFLAKFGAESQYVGLSTPVDAKDAAGHTDRYYVGFDRPSAVHPQTLLVFAMNGRPLSAKNGAPVRLVCPVKYGYKNIKRVSVIELSDRRPPDYWAQRGYDWYAGH